MAGILACAGWIHQRGGESAQGNRIKLFFRHRGTEDTELKFVPRRNCCKKSKNPPFSVMESHSEKEISLCFQEKVFSRCARCPRWLNFSVTFVIIADGNFDAIALRERREMSFIAILPPKKNFFRQFGNEWPMRYAVVKMPVDSG